MKGVTSWLWTAPLLLLLALFIHAPARLVQWLLPEQLVVQASSFEGTLWSGSARQVVMGSDGAYIAVDLVRWQLRPWSLLLFSPTADLQLQDSGLDATARLQWLGGQSWRADDLDLNVPAAVAGQFIDSRLPGGQLSGQLSLRLSQLQMAGDRIEEIDGNISWQPARWYNGGRWMDFGSLAGRLDGQAGNIRLQLFDLSGPLDVNGQLVLRPNGKMAASGTVGVRSRAPQEFARALALFAEQQADGKYKVDFQF